MKYSREKNNLKFNFHDRKPFSFITGISQKAFHFPNSLQMTRILDVQCFASSSSGVWAESIDLQARCWEFDRHPMLQLSLNM